MFLTSAPSLASIYHGEYAISLVIVSIFIAVLSTYFSLVISSRVQKVSLSRVRFSLLVLSATTMGLGIWTMHFVGMLAFKIDCQVSYEVLMTALSVLPAVMAGYVANDLLSRKNNSRASLLLGSLLIGSGIGAMHYSGMSAIQLEGMIAYDFNLLVLSIVFAIVLAYVALRVADKFSIHQFKGRLLVSAIIGLAISSMHYTAMSSANFVKGPAALGITKGIDNENLVVIVLGLFLFNFILVSLADFIEYYRSNNEHQISENEFHELIDTIEDYAIIKLDRNGNIRTWNKGAERIKGYIADEIIGKHFSIFYSEIDVASGRFSRILEWAKTSGRFEEEGLRVRKGGALFYANVVIRPIYSSEGNLDGFSKVTRDISERKLTEASLKEKQQLIASVTNAMNEGMYALDKHGKLVFMNPEAERTLGWGQDDLMGQPIQELIYTSKDGASYIEDNDEIIVTTIRRGTPYSANDVVFTTKYGVKLPVSVYASPRKNGEEVVGVVVVFRDIKREIQAQEVLRDQAQRMRMLLENSPISIRIKSRKTHRIVFANHSYAQMFGMTQAEVVGKDPMHYYRNPQDYVNVNERLEKGEVIKNYLVELKTDQDESLWVLATYMNIDYEVEPASIGWLYDVTELRHSRQMAEEAAKVKSDFLSMMSHEIRTPMNGVVGMVDLLSETPLDSEQREFVSVIKDSADALLEIINDILDFSKIEAGMLHIVQKEFSLISLVEGCVDLLASKAMQKHLAFTYFISPTLPLMLMGDAGRIRQVLLNLIGNAIKFTEQGHVHVNVFDRGEHEHKQHIEFEIIDSGIGISQSGLNNLFKPFSQADGSVSRKYGGTGLGLSICMRLAKAMQGNISVESEPGQGSTFRFTLMLSKASQQVADQPFNPLKDKQFLIVSPPSAARNMLTLYIKSWGGVAYQLDSPDTLSALPADEHYALLIVVSNPTWDAVAVAQQYMADNPEHKVLLLGDNEQLEALAESHIYKMRLTPLKQSSFYNTIIPILDRRTYPTEVTKERRTRQQDTRIYRKQGNILVVDDNDFNKKVAISQLKKLGYSVVTASNGQEAVEQYKTNRFDLILMDCHMPMMDGYEATAQIRELEQKTGTHIPIIAMTADAMLGGREICLSAGMDDYLCKPIDIEELGKVLQKVIMQPEPDKGWESLPVVSDQKAQKLLDLPRLRGIFGSDSRIKEVVQEFTVWMRQMLDELQVAMLRQDNAAIQASAHQIKGVALNLGIRDLGALCTQMEQHANAESSEVWQSIYQQMCDTQVALEALYR